MVQGIEYYRNSNKSGLFRPNLAGNYISDIQVVEPVDISENKVGKNISEAIKANELDVMIDFHKDFNVLVVMRDILDGFISEMEKNIKPGKINPKSMIFIQKIDIYLEKHLE